jgi:glutaredoxin 3
VARLELYGADHCPYTADLRDDLEWRGEAYTYFDVEEDAAARARLLALTGDRRTIPVLVADGRVREIGFRGRGCAL